MEISEENIDVRIGAPSGWNHDIHMWKNSSGQLTLTEQNVPNNWRLIVHHDDIEKALIVLALKITKEYLHKDVVLIGIFTGGAYFTIDLSRKLGISHSVQFIQASSYKNEQKASNKVNIIGLSWEEMCNLSGKHIIMVDELYDSGHTLHEIVEYFRKFQPLSISTCVMFRKQKPLNQYAPPNYCGIDNMPDVWFVGYGLDDQGTKREYLNLWGVPKAKGIDHSPDDVIFESLEQYQKLQKQITIN